MNFSFFGFGVVGMEGRCMSYPQAGEYNIITNNTLGGNATNIPKTKHVGIVLGLEWMCLLTLFSGALHSFTVL